MKKIYVVIEEIDGKWYPAIGGGSLTKPHVRAFETLQEAEHAAKHMNLRRGYDSLPRDTKRAIATFVDYDAWNFGGEKDGQN